MKTPTKIPSRDQAKINALEATCAELRDERDALRAACAAVLEERDTAVAQMKRLRYEVDFLQYQRDIVRAVMTGFGGTV